MMGTPTIAQYSDALISLAEGHEPVNYGSWAVFEAKLKADFTDASAEREAQETVICMEQNGQQLDEFLTEFVSLALLAGMTNAETTLMLEKAC